MAQERETDKAEIEKLKKVEAKMRGIIKSMQEQGRGGAPQFVDEEGTESEYEEDYEDEEDIGDDEAHYEVDTVVTNGVVNGVKH